MSELVTRAARLFRAGEYPDKGYTASEADLDRMVEATTGVVPLDLHHADTDETLPMGSLVSGSLRREGEWLTGTIAIPRSIDDALRHRGLSVVIDRATNALRKVTVTPFPRVAGAAFGGEEPQTAGDLIVFDGGMLMPEDTTATAAAQTAEVNPAAEGDEDDDDQPVVNWLLRRLGAGRIGKAAKRAVMSADAPVTQADLQAAVERAEAAGKAAALAEFEAQMKPIVERRKAERLAFELARGVPEWVARPAVAMATSQGTIAFSQANGESAELSLTQFGEDLLRHFGGATPAGRQMASGDRQGQMTTAEFDDKVIAKAESLRAGNSALTVRQSIDLARKEVGNG